MLLAQACVGFLISIFSFAHFYSLRKGILNAQIAELDAAAWELLTSVRSPLMTSIMKMISFFGAELTVVIACVVTFLFFQRKHPREAFLLPFAYGT